MMKIIRVNKITEMTICTIGNFSSSCATNQLVIDPETTKSNLKSQKNINNTPDNLCAYMLFEYG